MTLNPLVAYLRANGTMRASDATHAHAGWVCHPCEQYWHSDDPTCVFCGQPGTQGTLPDLFTPIHDHGINIGIPETHFEGSGVEMLEDCLPPRTGHSG